MDKEEEGCPGPTRGTRHVKSKMLTARLDYCMHRPLEQDESFFIPRAMLILREFNDVVCEVPELKVWDSVTAEVFEQLTAV